MPFPRNTDWDTPGKEEKCTGGFVADILIFTSTRKTYHGFVLSSQCVHQVGNLGFTDTQTHEHTLTFIKFCFQFDAIPLWRDLLSFKWENWNVQKHDSMKFLRVCVCCCNVHMLCYSMHWQWVDWRQPQLSLAVGSDCWLTADCWSPTLTSATTASNSETIAHRAPRPRTPATRGSETREKSRQQRSHSHMDPGIEAMFFNVLKTFTVRQFSFNKDA